MNNPKLKKRKEQETTAEWVGYYLPIQPLKDLNIPGWVEFMMREAEIKI